MNDRISSARAKQIVAVLATLMLVAFIGVGVVRIIQVNQKYPNPEIREYEMGEPVVEDGISLTVTDCEFIPDTQTRELFPAYFLIPGMNTGRDPKALLVTMVVKNEGDSRKSTSLYYYIQSASWYNGMDSIMFEDANPGTSEDVSLDAGQSMTVKLPFSISYAAFNDDRAWESFDRRSFDLVLGEYPDKVLIHLD
jgi:hypothetical protein